MDFVNHENLKTDSVKMGVELLTVCLPKLGSEADAAIAINGLNIALKACYNVLKNNPQIDTLYLLRLAKEEAEEMFGEESN